MNEERENIIEILKEWLTFSQDVQPSCAAGQDQLLYLESRSKAILIALEDGK